MAAADLAKLLYPEEPNVRGKISLISVVLRRMEKKGAVLEAGKDGKKVLFKLTEGVKQPEQPLQELPVAPQQAPLKQVDVKLKEKVEVAVEHTPGEEPKLKEIKTTETTYEVKLKQQEEKLIQPPGEPVFRSERDTNIIRLLGELKEAAASDLAQKLFEQPDNDKTALVSVYLSRLEAKGLVARTRKIGRKAFYSLAVKPRPEEKPADTLVRLGEHLGVEGKVLQKLKEIGESSASDLAKTIFPAGEYGKNKTAQLYVTLKRLEQKRMVVETRREGKKTYFSIAPETPPFKLQFPGFPKLPEIRMPSMPHIPPTYPAIGLSIVVVALVFYNFGGGMGFFAMPSQILSLTLDQQQVGDAQNFLYGVKNVNSHPVTGVKVEAILPPGSTVSNSGGSQVSRIGDNIILTWLLSQIQPNEKQVFSFAGKVPGQIQLQASGLSEQEEQQNIPADRPAQAILPAGEYGYKQLDVTPIGYLSELSLVLSAGPEGTQFTNETVLVKDIPIVSITQNITVVPINETQPEQNVTQPEQPPAQPPQENVTQPEQPAVIPPEQNVTPPAPQPQQPPENATPPPAEQPAPQPVENITPSALPEENATPLPTQQPAQPALPPTGGIVIPPTAGIVTPPEQQPAPEPQQPAPEPQPEPKTTMKIYLDPDTEFNGNEDLVGEQPLYASWDGTLKVQLPAKKYNSSMNLVFYSDKGAVVLVKSLGLKWTVELPINASESFLSQLYENVTGNVTENATEGDFKALKHFKAKFQLKKNGRTVFNSLDNKNMPKNPSADAYDELEINATEGPVDSIRMEGVIIGNDTQEFLDLSGASPDRPDKKVFDAYSIEPKIIFRKATMEATAIGSELYRCDNWDAGSQSCGGEWEKVQDLRPGKKYSMEFSSGSTAFMESSVQKNIAPVAQIDAAAVDKDYNGISDALDDEIKGKNERIRVTITLDREPTKEDFRAFESMGGSIENVFRFVSYGFAGSIDSKQLNKVSRTIGGVALIEGDAQGQGQMYYVSRAADFRPLIWNTYGFSGDRNGTIALAGSGVDVSHPDLSGYDPGDLSNMSAKIVGWFDTSLDVNVTPWDADPAGHDTGVAGIVAGTGNASTGARVNFTASLAPGTLPASGVNATHTAYLPVPGNVTIILRHAGTGSGSAIDFVFKNGTAVKRIGGSYTGTSPVMATFNMTEPGVYIYRATPDANSAGARYVMVAEHNTNNTEDSYIRGVANNTPIVVTKSWDSKGNIYYSSMMEGYDWLAEHRDEYKIRVMTTSTTAAYYNNHMGLRQGITNLAQSGIITLVAGGNGAPAQVPDPAIADLVITVGAMNATDALANYSCIGNSTINKPDVLAYGLGNSKYSWGWGVYTVGSNIADARSFGFAEFARNDYAAQSGSSEAAPQVAGLAYLITEAMESRGLYKFGDLATALKIKGIILMTATEVREGEDAARVPPLNRGGKDYYEGYGRFNPDAAIESVIKDYQINSTEQDTLSSSLFGRRAWARHLDFSGSTSPSYTFNLTVPAGGDFDLYIYNATPSMFGEPVILANSTTAGTGTAERIVLNVSGYSEAYLVVKRVSGDGQFTLTSTYGGGVEACGTPTSATLKVYSKPDYLVQNPLVDTGKVFYFEGKVFGADGNINNCSTVTIAVTNYSQSASVTLYYNKTTQTYRGNWTSTLNGVLNATLNATNSGSAFDQRLLHSYKGSGVAAYEIDFDDEGTNESVLENQHLAAIVSKGTAQKPLRFLLQKDQNVSLAFDDSITDYNSTSRAGFSSTSLNSGIYTTFGGLTTGESLGSASLLLKARQYASYSPTISYDSHGCGRDCTGLPNVTSNYYCTQHTFNGCTASTCNGNDAIIDIWTNGTVFRPGDTVNVTVNYRSFDATSIEVIAYYNGTGWRQVYCYAAPAKYLSWGGATFSYAFKLDNITGNHTIRAIASYTNQGQICGDVGTCWTGTLGDNDDLNVTVASATPERPLADVNLTMRDQDDDYLLLNVSNMQNLSNTKFTTDLFGVMGTSMSDEYYEMGNGSTGAVSGLPVNAWQDALSFDGGDQEFVAIYDNSANDGANNTVLSLVRYKETANVALERAGIRSEVDWNSSKSTGLRLGYSAASTTSSDSLSYLLVFTKGTSDTVQQWMTKIANGQLPGVNFLAGTDGTRPTINWVSPTPANGATVPKNWVYLNTTLSDASEVSSFYDWNFSLRGYWSFDRTNASGVIDNSTYGNFMLFKNGTAEVDMTSAYYGDGANTNTTRYLEALDSKSLNISGNNLTVEFWIYDPPIGSGDGMALDLTKSLTVTSP